MKIAAERDKDTLDAATTLGPELRTNKGASAGIKPGANAPTIIKIAGGIISGTVQGEPPKLKIE